MTLIFASPGQPHPHATTLCGTLQRDAQKRFPSVTTTTLFTSSLTASTPLPVSPHHHPHTIAVVPLHLTPGHEFSRLCNWLHQPNNLPTTIKIGTPLLSHHHATTTLFQAIISAATPTLAPDEALIMIAHHSRHPQAADTYHQAAAIARATSPHLFLGTHPNPANATAIAQTCHKLNYRHARLYPFTLTIGTTAQQILHPTAPNSWSTTLTQHHITATPHPIPLASHPTIIEYWLQQATQLLT